MFNLIPAKRRYDVPEVFREMEDFFKEVWRRDPFETMLARTETEWLPRFDLAETNDELIVKADMPGLDAKDLDITIEKDQLVIRGEKKEEKEERDQKYYFSERLYGSFYRAIQLPVEVNREKIDATFTKGVLTIVLPKVEEAKKSITHITVH